MALSSFGLEIGAENIGELCDRLYEAQYGRWAACSEPRIVRLRAGAGAHAVGRLGEGADAKGHGAEQGVEARLGAAVFGGSPWFKTEASSRSRSRGRPFWRISGRRAPGWYS